MTQETKATPILSDSPLGALNAIDGLILANTPVVLFAVDAAGTLNLLEGKGLEPLHVTAADCIGRSALDLANVLPGFPDVVTRALSGESVSFTAEVDELAFDIWGAPVQGQNGAISGMIGVAIDTTERTHLERQIYHQERLAILGQLAGGIAHDFNNFLTIIIVYARMILNNRELPPDLRSAAETIIGESRRASDLIDQILDFSRRSTMKMRTVDLGQFLEDVATMLGKTLPSGIHLVTDIDADGTMVNADPTRIQQLIMNLAVNARDAMEDGGDLRISLSALEVAPGEAPPLPNMDPGSWVCLSVADTGEGMSDEVLARVFEPFFTTKGTHGTGLGLPQVYGIVQQHEGHIDVQSAVGRGTTFRIFLPATPAQQPATAPSGNRGLPESWNKRSRMPLVEEEGKRRWICSTLETPVLATGG